MKLLYYFFALTVALPTSLAFMPSSISSSTRRSTTVSLPSTPKDNDKNPLQDMIKNDEGMMKAAAEQMKNLTPAQIDAMVKDMDNMGPIQRNALKALGMDVEAMKSTMQMMKDNPEMMQTAQKMMSNMTPEQLMEQSRRAQDQMKSMTPEQIKEANMAMSSIPKEALDQAADVISKQAASSSSSTIDVSNDDDDEPVELATGPGTSSDPNVVQAMYRVAEYMSNDGVALEKGIGGVTLAGFASLPPIQMLGGPREEDLSDAELKDCWATGSLGATRVDMEGFERVWKEVQEYFEQDIMGEARGEAKRRTTTKKVRDDTTTPSPAVAEPVKVGSSLDETQLDEMNKAFKNMSDDDMGKMFESMQNMDPATEARLKSMGTDPEMLKQTAKLMTSNPTMRQAAKEMMKNMSGKDMLKVSQQAQEQMKNMSPEQVRTMMNMSPEERDALQGMSMEEIQEAMKGKM